MKKFLVTILAVILCCAPLCACSTDFGAQIDETMDGLYQTLYSSLELFFKDANAPQKDDTDKNESENEVNNGENENVGGDEEKPEPEEPKYEIGTQVGQKLPSYTVQIFDENGISQEKIDPSALGKVTVINFWGTWCPPCVGELPEFSEVASEYKDRVTIVAIHSVQNFTVNAVSHIQNNFADSDIIFAMDENSGEGITYYDECYEAFGGNGYYPYTIILNENGVITYAKEGALTKAQLISKLDLALGN